MKVLLDFIPLVLFFIVYKSIGVQEAALVLVIATLIQLVALKWIYKKLEKNNLITGIAVILFGLLTVYFNDLVFLKWKVTIINGLFAIILLGSQFIFNKPLVQLLLGKELILPPQVWSKLNLGWASFFILCMLLNLVISEFFSDDIWANFKVFGLTGLSLGAVLITSIYLYPYLKQQQEAQEVNKDDNNGN